MLRSLFDEDTNSIAYDPEPENHSEKESQRIGAMNWIPRERIGHPATYPGHSTYPGHPEAPGRIRQNIGGEAPLLGEGGQVGMALT